jgi:nucleolin
MDDDASLFTSVFVGGLARSVSAEELRDVFEREFGPVVLASVPTDRLTGQSRGFGIVNFANAADAQQALRYKIRIAGRVAEIKVNTKALPPYRISSQQQTQAPAAQRL